MLIAEHYKLREVKPFTSQTCLRWKVTRQQGHGLINMSGVLRIGNQKKHESGKKACLSKKKKTFTNSRELFTVTIQKTLINFV